MFFELQSEQVQKWLLNPEMYAVVAVLLLLSWRWGIERTDRRFWRATANDYLYGLLYAILYFPLIAICLASANEQIDAVAPWLRVDLLARAPDWMKFLVIVLLDDFLAYWSHRLRHRYRPLWYFHSIHHNQERLNPFTTKRFHPLENLFHKLVILMIPMAIMGGTIELLYLYFIVDAAWDYFIHSNLRVNLGPLRYLLVTPQYHRVHHSSLPDHFDKNYADRFVIWDVLFGTSYLASDAYPPTGVPGYPSLCGRLSPSGMLRQHLRDLWYPFRMIAQDLSNNAPK